MPAQRVAVPREKPRTPDVPDTVHAGGYGGLSWGFRGRVYGEGPGNWGWG